MVENLIRRHVSKSEKFIQWVLILFTVFAGAIGILTIAMLPAFIIALATTLYYRKRLKDEYEYGYDKYNEILTIDQIIGKKKRKACLYAYMSEVVSICPYAESSVVKDKSKKVEDFASRNPDARVYVINVEQNNNSRYIIFEPQDDFLEAIQLHSPGKVKM